MIAGGVPSYGGHSREAKSSLQKMAVSVADLDQPLVRWACPKMASDGLTSQMASLYMGKHITSGGFLWILRVAGVQPNSNVPRIILSRFSANRLSHKEGARSTVSMRS